MLVSLKAALCRQDQCPPDFHLSSKAGKKTSECILHTDWNTSTASEQIHFITFILFSVPYSLKLSWWRVLHTPELKEKNVDNIVTTDEDIYNLMVQMWNSMWLNLTES